MGGGGGERRERRGGCREGGGRRVCVTLVCTALCVQRGDSSLESRGWEGTDRRGPASVFPGKEGRRYREEAIWRRRSVSECHVNTPVEVPSDHCSSR